VLAIHLAQHEGRPEEAEESRIDHLHGREVGWTPEFTLKLVTLAEESGLVVRDGQRLRLTDSGRDLAARTLTC